MTEKWSGKRGDKERQKAELRRNKGGWFFFSSRRRHTRYWRDWSSDVCSSDLVFLVISCPCALVVSVPLGYFGGIGAASRLGVLFKGGNYLDAVTRINTVVFDKTGTLTKGIFEVQSCERQANMSEEKLIRLIASVERNSTHPIAKAIASYAGQ